MFIEWMRAGHEIIDGDVIAIDGKTIRGSYDKSKRKGAIHMVSAFSTEYGVVLGQVKTDAKSNEITAIPELLNLLYLKKSLVTIDAMGCQKNIAEKIKDKKADYLLAVKGNQGKLHDAFKEYFPLKLFSDYDGDSFSTQEVSHGRQEIQLHIVSDVTPAFCDNAIPHTGNQYILKLDLKDFFPSIKASYVYFVFRAAGYSKQIAYSLTSICMLNGYLPQGAPTSPCLSNLVCLRLDQRIGKYCDRHALTFTRYADDISISGNKLSIVKKAWVVIKLILSEEGYVINKKKEMLSGPRSKREITGLVVTPKLGIGQRKYNMYRNKIFHLCHKNDNESILIIQGILAYIKDVDHDRYNKLKRYYDALKTKEVTE